MAMKSTSVLSRSNTTALIIWQSYGVTQLHSYSVTQLLSYYSYAVTLGLGYRGGYWPELRRVAMIIDFSR